MLEKKSMDFAYDTFMEMKDKQLQKNEESYRKYMYALQLRREAAKQIGIDNIRIARLRKMDQEEDRIMADFKNGQQMTPDFRLILLARLEA